MTRLIFITHPEVAVQPEVPVARWRLSEAGRRRMRAFAADGTAAGISAVWASEETKAIEAAEILARALGLAVRLVPELGENDRSATGYLPPEEFERTADAFFASPEESVRGWERAVDAQARIRAAVTRIAEVHRVGDVAVVAHGAVGTLLLCALAGLPISRTQDQPFQGHYWAAELPEMALIHRWRAIAARQDQSSPATLRKGP